VTSRIVLTEISFASDQC